jgi:DNA polymerase-1
MPDELLDQWGDAPAFFDALGWVSLDAGDLEADDLLGALPPRRPRPGAARCCSPGTATCSSASRTRSPCSSRQRPAGPGVRRRGRGARALRHRARPGAGLHRPARRPLDGLPGAKGIGEKTAAELLRAHGDLEALIALAADPAAVTRKLLRPRQAGALVEQADELRSFRDIATLRPIPVRRPPDRPTDGAGGAAAARERGMLRLAERLEKLPG